MRKKWVPLTSILAEAVALVGMCDVRDITFFIYCICTQNGIEVRDGGNPINWVAKQDKYGNFHASCTNLYRIAKDGLWITRNNSRWNLTRAGVSRIMSYRSKYGPLRKWLVKRLTNWLYGDLDTLLSIARMCDSSDEDVDKRTRNILRQLADAQGIEHGTIINNELIMHLCLE